MIKELIQTIYKELRDFYQNNLRQQDPFERMGKQLRLLYGRGEITRDKFFLLRDKLYQGQAIQEELAIAHRIGVLRLEERGERLIRQSNKEIALSLERLYLDRAMLEEVRFEILQSINNLQDEANWARQQAESTRQAAQAVITDEAEARSLLNIWQDLLELAENLERRMQLVRHSLSRINALEARIRAYEAELKALDSNGHLEEIRKYIDQDFNGQGSHA
jgi:vacuolar-type H+-ATPase subunit I/STV1